MGKVLHTKGTGGSGGGGLNFKFTATNYTDLLTKVGMVEGDLAYVYNGQGVWPINRRTAGVYMFQSGVWNYASQELQDQIIVSQGKVKIDSADSVYGYLEDKLIAATDTFLIPTAGPNKTLSIDIRDNIKSFATGSDPTVNDDITVTDLQAPFQPKYRVGQTWINTTSDEAFICKDLTTGAAIWDPVTVQSFNIDLDSAESSVTRVVAGGRTTFTVTHNLNTLDLKPEVFRLSDGRTLGWRVERTGVNTVEVSRNGNVADGLFRILI